MLIIEKFKFLLLILLLSAAIKTSAQMKYLALGDSYTIGESVPESERWPVQLTERLRSKGLDYGKPTIIATTGWRTDNLSNAMTIARLKPEYDLVSLLIGVNNQYQGKPIAQFEIDFENLLKTAIELAKGNKEKVFVVSIPDYGFTPYGLNNKEKISKQIDEFNEVSRKIVARYQITYVDITPISRQGLEDTSLVAGDGLHPSGKMYSLWVEKIIPALR